MISDNGLSFFGPPCTVVHAMLKVYVGLTL